MSKSKKLSAGITYNDLLEAYLKFKSYIYNENFSVNIKIELAKFERTYKQRLKKLAVELASCQRSGHSVFIATHINNISYSLMPKKFKDEVYDLNDGSFISNKNQYKNYEIDDLNKLVPFFRGSIELHIISTLWTLRIGTDYERNLSPNAYANRLHSRKELRMFKLRFFKKYYHRYNAWRDRAINAARFLHESGHDVAILNLDIKSYYHSIDLDLSSLRVSKQNKWLNQILISIHTTYVNKLFADNILSRQLKILPIGLVSSSILANFYLQNLDKNIKAYAVPWSYGRYVDDFLFVFQDPVLNENKNKIVSDFIDRNIVSKKPHSVSDFIIKKPTGDYEISIAGNGLQFQLSKVKLYYFKKEDSIELLEEFKKEIERNSSEFRLQVEEEELKNPFEDSVYKITYSDTINKLRSVDSFTPNKFGASKQLAKIIYTTKYLENTGNLDVMELSPKITNYFEGRRSLELFQLWEKAFAFFVINNDSKGLIKFSNQLIASISKVKVNIKSVSRSRNEELTRSVYEALISYLKNGYSTAAALDINFFDTKIVSAIKSPRWRLIITKILRRISVREVKQNATQIINANLFNHSYTAYPLLNYCKQFKNFSFSRKVLKPTTSFEFHQRKLDLSPRFINFDEVELFNFLKFNLSGKPVPASYATAKYQFNKKTHLSVNLYGGGVKKEGGFENITYKRGKAFDKVLIASEDHLTNIRIGLANIKLDLDGVKSSIQDRPLLTLFKLNQINKALNEAIRNSANIIVFPEVSVPLQWVSKLAFYARKNNIAIICGVEHFTNRNEVYNYACTILPFTHNRFTYAHVDFRLKMDYSPDEILLIKSGKLKPANRPFEKLKLFHWRGVYFAVFNCFEFADIEKRSLFRGKVDIVFTVEYNKDTTYFSNINESLARDIHAYTIQVNSSDYGDSRITMPKKTVERDYIKIKGGENIYLIVGDLDIQKLRDFQKLSSDEQMADKTFKHTPPNFVYQKND